MSFVVASPLAIPFTAPQAVPATSGTLRTASTGTPTATVVLAHGAGSGPDSDVLVAVAEGLAARGCAVLSFAFAYRAAGRRAPDPAPRLLSAWRDAIAGARAAGAPGPLVLGGFSMGGRMASMLAAQDGVGDALVLLSYPLLSQRAGAAVRTAHWPALRMPTLFVSGDRDRLCPLDELARERAARLTAPSDLVVVTGADHSLKVPQRPRSAVLTEVAGAVAGRVASRSAGVA